MPIFSGIVSGAPIALVRGKSAGAIAATALVVALSAGNALAARTRAPNLVLASLSPAPATQLGPGSTVAESFTERNEGAKRAGRSPVVFYLSSAAALGPRRTTIGNATVKALKPHQHVKESVRLTIPAGLAGGSYFLIGCAGAPAVVGAVHRGARRHKQTNCRAARGRLNVKGSGGDTEGGGHGGSNVNTPLGGAPCVPIEAPQLSSSSPSCFDGDAADGVFVSGIGADSNPGTMSAPKRTLAAGITLAAELGKDVYVTEGEFQELLLVADGVSVYGGYDPSWQRSPAYMTKTVSYTHLTLPTNREV